MSDQASGPETRPHIVICGYGPGIGAAVASRFGEDGFDVSLVARTDRSLASAAEELSGRGVSVAVARADLTDHIAARDAVSSLVEARGRLDVLHWNAVATLATDLLGADSDALDQIGALGLVAPTMIVQSVLPTLRESPRASLLLTGGGLAFDQANGVAVAQSMDGVALTKALQHKLFGLLSERLESAGVMVGEAVVAGGVRSERTPDGTVSADAVAQALHDLHHSRDDRVRIVGP